MRSSRFRPQLEVLESRLVPTWARVASLPAEAADATATALLDGRIMAVGLSGAQAAIYNPSNNRWTPVNPLPSGNTGYALATGGDGRVYAIGGIDVNTVVNAVFAYNPNNNSWAPVAPLTVVRTNLAAAMGSDGRVYAIGGTTTTDATTVTNIVEIYNPSANAWIVASPLNTARAGLAAATGPDGRVYAIGGTSDGTTISGVVEAYDVAQNFWSPSVTAMITPRMNLAAATGPDGLVYAIGGDATGQQFVTTVEAYSTTGNAWANIDPVPTGRDNLGAARGSDGRIYAIGGTTIGGPTQVVEAFTVGAIPPPPPPPPVPDVQQDINFVTLLYEDLLGREPDTGGLIAWVSFLQAGVADRFQVALAFENSFEYRSLTIQDQYATFLNRSPDPAGMDFWLSFLAGGGTPELMESFILSSDEYFLTQGGGTNQGFLDAVYADVLGRAIDPLGAETWGLLLAQGAPRVVITNGVVFSLESNFDEVNGYYLEFLLRPADQGGLIAFVNALQAGYPNASVIASILSSDEYFALAQALAG